MWIVVIGRFDEKIDDDLKSIFDDLRITLPDHLPSWLPIDAINVQVLLPNHLYVSKNNPED